jgi:hypothetical protein
VEKILWLFFDYHNGDERTEAERRLGRKEAEARHWIIATLCLPAWLSLCDGVYVRFNVSQMLLPELSRMCLLCFYKDVCT